MPTLEKISFDRPIRDRANKLINVLPFEHKFKEVLSAIAHVDYHSEHSSVKKVKDCELALRNAGVTCNFTAAAYLDWIEDRISKCKFRYQNMLDRHRQEIDNLMAEFQEI